MSPQLQALGIFHFYYTSHSFGGNNREHLDDIFGFKNQSIYSTVYVLMVEGGLAANPS